jgi:hypothetical protein
VAGFTSLLKSLRRAEHQLETQLEGIRNAIASLEFGGAVSPGMPGGRRSSGRPKGSGTRRTISAKGRKAISEAQKARWARLKAEEKRK